MDELDPTEMIEDVNQLKGQMNKILKILQTLETRNDMNTLEEIKYDTTRDSCSPSRVHSTSSKGKHKNSHLMDYP